MNLNEIQDLIKFVSKSGVTEVEIEQKDFKITIKAEKPASQIMVQAAAPALAPVPQVAATVAQVPAAVPTVSTPAASAEDNYITVKSPMIGTFYRSSGPDKEAFMQIGKKVAKGDTVCIIEAMKLFNEIESEVSGTIIKVLVDDASPVEYDQPLFLVDPA